MIRALRRMLGMRETRSYTSAVVNAIESAAAGTGGVPATATAAVETAAGLWGRGAGARDRRAAEPADCGDHAADARDGRAGALPLRRDHLRHGGSRRPSDDAARERRLRDDGERRPSDLDLHGDRRWTGIHHDGLRGRSGVAHLQYMVDPVRPWLGRPPWASASLSASLLAGIERQLSGEAGSASGYILPTPDVGDRGQEGADADEEEDPLTTLRRDLAAAGGKTMLAPTTSAGYGAGPGAALAGDYKSERFGFHPPELKMPRAAEVATLARVMQSLTGGPDRRAGPRGCRPMTASGCDHSTAVAWPCGEGVTRWRCPDCGRLCVTPPIQASRRGAAAARW